jgi:general secretion pathway protein D
MTGFSTLLADSTGGSSDSQDPIRSADLLQAGIDQYNHGDYEKSVATLQEVDLKSLSDADHQTLVEMLAKANEAATERRAARAEFARGEEARRTNRLIEAKGHYEAVLSNTRADDETRQKAQLQLDLLNAAQKNASGDAKAAYDRGVEEYKSGQWQQARADFLLAEQLQYDGGFLQASPAEYLQKIDDGEKKYMAQQAAAKQDAAPQDAAPATRPSDDGKAEYDRARQEYRAGDWVGARADFAKAKDLGYEPGFLQGLSPDEYLQRMDEKDAADQQHAMAVSGMATASGQTVNLADDTSSDTSGGNSSSSDQLQHQAEVDRIAEQQRIYAAQGQVDLGKKAEAAGNDQEALDDYTRAVSLDPTNAEAVRGRDRMLAKLGRGPAAGGATLTRTQQQIQTIIQSIDYKFTTALDQARKDTAASQFAAAEDDIANAQAARDEDPTVFNADDLRRMDSAIAQARVNLERAKAAYDQQTALQRAVESTNVEIRIQEIERHRRESTVAALIKQSRTLIEQQNYAGALGVLDQIISIDPQNDYALGVRQFVEDKAVIQEQKHYRQEFDYNLARSLNSADEAQIPYEDIYRFPENWPDISTLRDNELKNSNVSKEDQLVQAQLDRRLPSVGLSQVALADAMQFLRDLTDANILVNWKALEQEGIGKDTQVTANLHDVKFSKVLDIILQEAGGGKLAYTIDEGVITISTADELNKSVVTRVYDVTDLLINPNFDSNIQNLSSGGAQITGSGGGGGSSSFGQNSNSSSSGGAAGTQRAQQLMDLEKKIENTVAFSSWSENDPNGYGKIEDFNNQLIITQTTEVHQKISDLLSQLREAQAVQVSIEARFLTVSRHFLEDVGVNLSMAFNTQNPRNWSPITVTNGTSGFTANPSTGLPGTLGTNNAVSGLSVGGTYGILDDFQVALLVTAVEASERLSVVHAPKVTLQNGQGATMYQETFIPYVSSLNTTVAAGAAIAAPVISDAEDGVILVIERALVTADHKYVTLDLDPQLDAFLGFTTFEFETAAPTTTSTGGVLVGGFSAPTLTVQEATEQKTEVRTRVTVPDGGTLLLGGVVISGEINLQAGVPGLSQIPFLNRLTDNTSESNDEQVLLILVKPTIIINKEIEAKDFPLLSSTSK